MGDYSKYIRLRLDYAEKFSGEEREDIIKRWLTYFEGHDELVSELEDVKDLQNMDDQLKDFEHNVDFDLYWMTQYRMEFLRSEDKLTPRKPDSPSAPVSAAKAARDSS